MSDILDREYNISSYLKHKDDGKLDTYDDNDKITDLLKYQEESDHVIIIPTGDLADLESQWVSFNNMVKHHRRESDWKSIELFGKTNQERYEELRNMILRDDIPNYGEYDIPINDTINHDDVPVTEGAIGSELDLYYDMDEVNYSGEDVDKAIKWSEESNRVIIVPTRSLEELESLWDSFNGMVLKHRRESDWMSEELFGVTNLRHYEFLKNNFLRLDIDKDREFETMYEHTMLVGDSQRNVASYLVSEFGNMSRLGITKRLLEMSLPDKPIYEELLTNTVISDVIDAYEDFSIQVPTMDLYSSGDLPYYDPEDMIDMGVFGQSPSDNYYGCIPDNTFINEDITVREWFEMYKYKMNGMYSEYSQYTSDWISKIRELTFGLDKIKESGDENAINARKQSILELGWNPDVPFTNKNRVIAKEIVISKLKIKEECSQVIDLKHFRADDKPDFALREEFSETPLKPIFIILTEGATAFSSAIKMWTNSIYSHASIAFDSSLKEMYSYGINNSPNGIRGGFIKEDVKNTPKGKRIGVYTFFVSENVLNKVKEMIASLQENIHKTSYSYTGIAGLMFHIPENSNWNMFCSQFVDRMMKLVGINITNKKSGLVTPEDLKKGSKKNRKIYSVYEGLASKYNSYKIHNLIMGLMKKAKPIKESHHVVYTEKSYINSIISNIDDPLALMEMSSYIHIVHNKATRALIEKMVFEPMEIEAYCEAKEFPVQFDKDGNLLLKNLKKIDYDAEYSKSHKLLRQYEKYKNLEGMKYELSKLWMMLCLIEERIHDKNVKESEIDRLHKSKAAITNDFKHFLDKVMEIDPEFNFGAYYDDSPFSSATIKVNYTTMAFIVDIAKKFVRPLIK